MESIENLDNSEGYFEDFAATYDALTFNVPYDEIADYYAKILGELTKGRTVLDMGCGTGSLTVKMKRRGFDVIGQDASSDMLSYAAEKSGEVLWICQLMEETELAEPVDAVISTLDSVNHLPSKTTWAMCFRKVYENLKSGGAFVFDVNTVYKHREILGGNTFVYDVDGVYCVWQNSFDAADNGVNIDLDLFFEEAEGEYSRGEEHFREIAFSESEIREMLEAAGFEIVSVREYLTFDSPKENSEKLTFAARKK